MVLALVQPSTPLERRATLLEELTLVTQQECTGHDELIARYESALESSELEANDSLRTRLRVGRLSALILRQTQLGDRTDADEFTAELLRLQARQGNSEVTTATLDALAEQLAAELVDGPSEPCASVEPEPSPVAASPSAKPAPSSAADAAPLKEPVPTPVSTPSSRLGTSHWSNRDVGLVTGGAFAVAIGSVGLVLGITGPSRARASSKISDEGPTPEQRVFLDETVPRRSAAWISISSVAITAGVGLIVGGLLAHRQRTRRSTARQRTHSSM